MPKNEDLFALPPGERLKRYRQRARDARRAAELTNTPALQMGYLRIAGHWDDLAELLERSMRLHSRTLGADRPSADGRDADRSKE